MTDCFEVKMTDDDIKKISTLGLAHVGDAVYELLVRTSLLESGLAKSSDLHRLTVSFVSAPAQARAVDTVLPCLSQEELGVFKRGRNAHVHAVPKNATPGQYGKATGLEALFGWLWLKGRKSRISQLFDIIMSEENKNAL